MTVRFTHVRLVGGVHHHHIARLRAVSDGGQTFDDTREAWVAFVESNNSGYVQDAYGNTAWVAVHTNGFTKWLQTYADGVWTDNLLALPRY